MYEFIIYDEPKRQKYFRYGELKKIIYKDGYEIESGSAGYISSSRVPIKDDINNLKRIIIESHFQKKESEPYPNFMQIRWGFGCADKTARELLDKLNLDYKTVEIEITNGSEYSYKVIFFKRISNLIDLDKSNLFLGEDGYVKTNKRTYFSPIESTLFLTKDAGNIKGIYELKERGSLICDHETMEQLKKSGLTGFYFEELEVSAKKNN